MNNFFNKKRLKFIFKAVVTLLFLWWVIFKVDWWAAWESLQAIRWYHLLIYTGLYYAGLFFSAIKWKILAETKGFKHSTQKYFNLYYSATFVNNFAPSFIGGDAYKSYELGKEGKRFKSATSSVVIDRIAGLIGAMILAVFFFGLNFQSLQQHKLIVLINLGIVSGIVAFLLILKFPQCYSFLPLKIRKLVDRVVNEVKSYQHNSGALFRSILFSFWFNLFGVLLANAVLFWALGVNVGWLNYLSVIFLIGIVSSTPITINNIGIKEWAYITFFGLFGASATAMVTVVLLSRFLQMFFSFLAWPIFMRREEKL
ncbi:MAG TPA: flippase-like domain-containing protein [Candidatus Moranbacteria bacterium]|nr:flippase-like domain-containing protein [Candidatus Moranbacteria bacterium]